MATQGMFNLFGASPEEIRAKYEQGLMGKPRGGGLGRQLGYTVGRMLGGRLPGEAEAEAQQAALLEAQQSGLSGSALYKRLAETTADPRRGLQFAEMARQAEAAEAQAAQDAADAALARRLKEAQVKEVEGKPKVLEQARLDREEMLIGAGLDAKKAASFSKSPEISAAIIKDAMKPKEGVKLTSEQALAAKEAGLPVLSSINSYTPAQAGEIRKRVLAAKQKVAEAGSTKALNAYAGEVGKLTAQEDVKLIADVRKAPAAISKLRETLEILHKSDDELTTGIGADVRNLINKAKAQFLNDEKAGKDVENTEYLRALLGSDVFAAIGAFGIGARGLDTPAERDFLLDVVAGRIGLDRGTLIKMTQFRLEAAEKGITDFNSRFDAGDFNKYQETTGKKLNKVVLPEWTPPVLPAKPGQPAPAGGAGWSIKKKG